MPLHAIPVVIPWQLGSGPTATTHTTGVQAVATTPAAALAVSKMLVQALAAIRHPGVPVAVDLDRSKVGAVGAEIMGPYVYVFGTGSSITHLSFPARIDQDAGARLNQSLDGLDPTRVQGVLMDCVLLNYINSSGLAALAGAASKINIQLFRVPPPILKVLQMTGLDRLIPNHSDMATALAALTRKAVEDRVTA